MTSGPQDWRRARTAAVRHISFLASVPHWLEDGAREIWEPDDFMPPQEYDDVLRRENDAAFTNAISALFRYLSSPSWAQKAKPLSLSIQLQAEKVYTQDMDTEPGTGAIEQDRNPLPEYYAKLAAGTLLQTSRCVHSVQFPIVNTAADLGKENGVSVSAQAYIIAACGGCPSLLNVKLNGHYQALRENHAAKRNDLATGLQNFPRSVRTLSIDWQDGIWQEQYREVAVVPETVAVLPDPMCIALHTASLYLRELRLHSFHITPDLFRMSEQESSTAVLWPNLEIFQSTSTPTCLPDGTGLTFIYSGAGPPQPITTASRPGDERLDYVPNRSENTSIVATYFDELYATAGRAAVGMPKLRNLLLRFRKKHVHELELCTEGEQRVLYLCSSYGYSPTQTVLNAWNLRPGQMELRVRQFRAAYEQWPPV